MIDTLCTVQRLLPLGTFEVVVRTIVATIASQYLC